VWGFSSAARREELAMEADWTRRRGWTSPRVLSTAGTWLADGPALAVNGRGDAVVAWTEEATTPDALPRLRARFRPVGGQWGPARTLSSSGERVGGVQVGIDGRGRALLGWLSDTGSASTSSTRLELASGNVRRGGWTKPRTLEASSGVAIFRLALNARGEAILVWSKPGGDALHDNGIWVETRSTSGRWSTPRRELPPVHDRDRSYWQLVFNDRGEAILGWDEYESDNSFRLTVAVRPPHKHFLPPQQIGDDPYFGYALAVGRNDEALAIWASYRCCLYTAATRPGGDTFGSARTLATGIWMATDPTVAFDAHGNAVAIWARTSENNHLLIHAAARPSGGSFDTGVDLADIGEDSYKHAACSGAPTLALAPDGRLAVAVWLARQDPRISTACSVVGATDASP
jgi:hypothetical protein